MQKNKDINHQFHLQLGLNKKITIRNYYFETVCFVILFNIDLELTHGPIHFIISKIDKLQQLRRVLKVFKEMRNNV